MDKVGQRERATQNRVVQLFEKELGYTYLGDWEERKENSNIEVDLLVHYLQSAGYSDVLITQAIKKLSTASKNFNENLYNTNKSVYGLLRFGADVKVNLSANYEKVFFINWGEPEKNHFAIAEEVTIKGNLTKRPDIVLYVNGIAIGVLELKRSTVSIGDGIRQSIVNQQEGFIEDFFATVQYIFAGNDTEGLRYGTIGTSDKYFLSWKEDIDDDSRNLLDKYLLRMCDKRRLIEVMYDFVLFDGGQKKLPRVHQYFGIKEAQKYINRYEGGIIWHTQGSGKSLTMVWLAKWILENNPNARVVLLTDRTELDKQIKRVFEDVGKKIHRAKSGRDLMLQLEQAKPRLICSLVHKFGKKDTGNFKKFIEEIKAQPSKAVGELFVFVDECHRTQSGRLHKTMKAILPKAVFVGFTGTPLLKKDKRTSLEVFGKYIHTYKFNEGVTDGVILDLVFEARDIDQRLGSKKKVDKWFATVSEGMNDYQKSELKKKWGTMQKVLSSKSRMQKIIIDIELDFRERPRLKSQMGNAILVANSIYEACKYYHMLQESSLRDKVAIVTSYNPHKGDITTEDTGDNTDTEKEFMYNLYTNILKDVKKEPNKTATESYEDWAKAKFSSEPANMKLLVVVSKLLTGFDAPPCTFLYIDKKMQDHGLFQAICRVNRLDGEDKLFGYIVDYKDIFTSVEKAVSVYTADLDYDNFEADDIDVMLHDRLVAGREKLENALEEIHLLCEPVSAPKDSLAYIRYFCGNVEKESDLKERETKRIALYKKVVALVRAFANIADDLDEAGYTDAQQAKLKVELNFYLKLREEIKKASGETIDLKAYEADMRYLIDTFIEAKDSKLVTNFNDMPLIDVIINSGIAEAINSLPDGIKSSQEAVAETIENNVRKKIIKDHLIDPAYFKKMSKLLNLLIKERKAGAIEYKEYLKRIAKLAEQAKKGKGDDTPDGLDTAAKRALYNNLGKDENLAILIDTIVKNTKKDGFRGNLAKEREIKAAIYNGLKDYEENADYQEENYQSNDGKVPYGLIEKVESIFKIIVEQKEY